MEKNKRIIQLLANGERDYNGLEFNMLEVVESFNHDEAEPVTSGSFTSTFIDKRVFLDAKAVLYIHNCSIDAIIHYTGLPYDIYIVEDRESLDVQELDRRLFSLREEGVI